MKVLANFLKLVVLLIALPVFAACLYGLTRFDPDSPYWALPELAELQYPVLIGMYAAMIPFFYALYQIFKLLGALGKGRIFTPSSLTAVRNIKYAALAICFLYILELPFLHRLAQVDDAPATLIGLFVITVSGVIAVITGWLQKRMRKNIPERAAY